MTEGPRASSLAGSVAAAQLEQLVALGAQRGSVTVDDVVDTLSDVELTPELIDEVRRVLEQRGVAFDELDHEIDDDLHDDDRLLGTALANGLTAVATPPASSPKPTSTPAPRSPSARSAASPAAGDGGTPRPPASSSAPAATDSEPAAARRRARSMGDPGRAAGASADPVRMYLKEIGRVPLLTAGQEVSLAERIQAGLAAEERLDHLMATGAVDRLTERELAELNAVIADGDEAKSQLIQANLRLVVSIAKRYQGRGLLFLDLIQEGNLGLMRAVEKFDHTKGFKFSTYATWWIRQAITRAIADQARTIRIPVHMVETINKVHRVQRQMIQDLEREPTVEELADKVDLDPGRVREILRISQDPLSLDSPVGEEDDSNLADFIEDLGAEAPAAAAAKAMLNDAVMEALEELSERERMVVRLRFGLDDGQARTLEEVGREFGVTRERIRQIESKTLAKLRHPLRSQKLRDYLDDE